MRPVYVLAARRTRVAPRGGAFASIEVWDLGAATIRAALKAAETAPEQVEGVLMGNALYGGGNPARMAGLAARLPRTTPAATIDTQCCSGLDAVGLAAERIGAGAADLMIAGGLESFSRAPIRMRRPRAGDAEQPVAYERPPFAPDPASDPDPGAANTALAVERGYDDAAQAAFAVESHAKARAAADRLRAEIAPVPEAAGSPPRWADDFTRALSPATCRRAGASAVTAVEADATAALVLSATPPKLGPRLRVLGAVHAADDPARPTDGAIRATRLLLDRQNLAPADLSVVELMEAYAAQAMSWRDAFDTPPERINLGGGALARGHPIGASGAVLATRLVHELAQRPPGAIGLAAISAVGGLGAALALQREEPGR